MRRQAQLRAQLIQHGQLQKLERELGGRHANLKA